MDDAGFSVERPREEGGKGLTSERYHAVTMVRLGFVTQKHNRFLKNSVTAEEEGREGREVCG